MRATLLLVTTLNKNTGTNLKFLSTVIFSPLIVDMHEIRVVRPAILSLVILFGSQAWSLNQGLTNQNIKVAAVPWGPFLVWRCPGDSEWSDHYFRECPNGEERLYKGVLWELLRFMQQARNCKFTFDTSQQDWYGNCYGSDNCTGMIGMANRREVDFALGMFQAKYN